MSIAYEVNFDGLVGPTHHYAGLSFGNLASQGNANTVSNPKAAALQGLAKMRLMVAMGLKQGILLPQPRPPMHIIHRLGFIGEDQEVLEKLARSHPALFSAFFSSSAMWTANAATLTPSADSADQKVHITPANLSGNFHRAIESEFTYQQLQAIFAADCFTVHPPLRYGVQFSDEGAANHTRLCASHAMPGVHVFAYGRSAFAKDQHLPADYPARQTLEASEAIARTHHLATPGLFFQQNTRAIDAGVFHNDVIAVGNESVFLCHEYAYQATEALGLIKSAVDFDLTLRVIRNDELSVQEAVSTYLFNSQLITLPDRSMALILPTECEESSSARAVVDRLLSEKNPIERAEFIDCRQSMRNGGGPACLRLRVVLTERELQSVNPHYLLDEHKIGLLESWVHDHYRDRLTADDFLDKAFREECDRALAALSALLITPPRSQ
jgi:succinylarginine dihydrolase